MISRARRVFSQELTHTLGRPLFWFLVVLLFLLSWGLSTGRMQIGSGDATVGGMKAWITSEFSVSFVLTMLVALLYSFFLSIAAGLSVIRDDELRIGEILHTTSLKASEYVWGKFLAVLTAFLLALGLNLLFAVFFNHVLPNPQAEEIRGPFELLSYLRPALIFAIPTLIFVAGVTFYLGERWRRPVTVFLFPVAMLLGCGFFLWNWSPTWLDPRINRALMLVDPAGFRWLNETWIKLDRGARFYNTTRIAVDLPFALSRLAFAGLGLLGVTLARQHFERTLRGERVSVRGARKKIEAPFQPSEAPVSRPLSVLAMRTRPAGLVRGTLRVAGTEARSLFSSPALYLFATLILLQTLGNALTAIGPFGTSILLTPGLLAVQTLNPLTLLLCLLLMFYTAESLERDRSTGLSSLAWSAPIPTASILAGKVVANGLVGMAMAGATFIGCAVALLVQGKVLLNPLPFLLVWGLLLVPTILLWAAFVVCVQSVTGQRFATYGVCAAVLTFTLYRQLTDQMNWVGNWMLWSAVRWTDLGPLEMDRKALVLNRILALGLAVFFTAVAVRAFGRRQADAIGTLNRFQGAAAARTILRLAPFAAVPVLAGVFSGSPCSTGSRAATPRKRPGTTGSRTWPPGRTRRSPTLAAVDLDLVLDPENRAFHNRGTYELVNDRDVPLARFALTGGRHWKKVRWTMEGNPYQPDDRSGLYVFTPPSALPLGGRLRVGFEMEGRFPEGITKNGGGMTEFILPSGVVLTSFSPSFVPVIGYDETIGIKDEENDYEPRLYPDDYYLGKTDAFLGLNRSFRTRIKITGPAGFTWNSVGTKVSETVQGDRRTAVWVSDQPVRFFNVVGGRWHERRGKTAPPSTTTPATSTTWTRWPPRSTPRGSGTRGGSTRFPGAS